MVPDISLGAGVPRLVSGLGTSFLLLCLFGFEVLRGFRACSVGVLHFLLFPLFPCLTLHTSMGPGRSSVLRIGSNPVEASSSRWTDGAIESLAVVVHRAAPREPPFSLDKGKGKINEIRYPSGSEYLRATIQNDEVVGPNRVEPLYGEIFAAWYGPLFGIQIWCPDVLTTYVVQVPKMVCFFEVATYSKGLASRASLTEGSARTTKSYKVKVASLTSERAGLQAQIRELAEELVKHRSDLKHASVARARAEDKEKEARKDAKVAEDELRLAREELQTFKGDLWAKMAALERARQEGMKAGNSVEWLTEELGRLRMDLARQEALASRRGEVIAELKDEACTQWASGWLAFQH